jgi:hypothetical protein
MQRVDGKPAWDASSSLLETVAALGLESDIRVVLIIESSMKISLEAASVRGEEVLSELRSRSQFLPCPEGECEYGPGSSMCKWCGNQVK